MSESRKKRLVGILRRRLLSSPDRTTDEQILKITKGTLMRSGAEIDIVKQDFATAIRPILDDISKKINKVFKYSFKSR